MHSALSEIQRFRDAQGITHGFSVFLTNGRDVMASGDTLASVAGQLEAVVRSPDLAEHLKAENPEVLGQLMDGLSLDLAALRMNIREGGRLFHLIYFRSIRRFYRTAERIARATDAVRAHLPKPDAPTAAELDADAAELKSLLDAKDQEWIDFEEVLQEEDRERWQTTE